ncbi:MAG: DUF5947 family protein [Candidatus Nanopelagicales bacterium]
MTGQTGSPLAVLQRIQRSRPLPPPGESCEMCAAPIVDDDHSHVVNIGSRSLMCTCRGCYLLFTSDDATLAYRAVPDRYLSFPSFELTQLQWDDLQIPVGIAFFFNNSQLEQTIAFYPSPAGATESELPLGAWVELVSTNPALGTLRPDVEALLVRDRGADFDCYLVPIDACYELVGHLRKSWRGFDGGEEVHRRLEDFFTEVRNRSRPAPAVVPSEGGK